MGHDFELIHEIELDATPEEVWQAIATGPGMDSWFMGRTTIEPHEGGVARTDLDGFALDSTVVAWEPQKRFAFRAEPGPDGAFMAFDYLIEGRDGASTVLRLVHSGFLGGDDWESEYQALREGNPLYLRTLGHYLDHFTGRTATPVGAWAPPQEDGDALWATLCGAVGLTGTVAEGDAVRFSIGGDTVDGVVDTVLAPGFLGVRSADALYRFVGGGGMLGVGHHLFAAGVDAGAATRAWSAWLAELVA